MDDPSQHPDRPEFTLVDLPRHIAIAGVFLTRLPFRVSGEFSENDLAHVVHAFPIVGLIVGALSGSALLLTAEFNLHPVACAMFAIAAAVLATGALHEDGLADVADGFGGGRSREQKLEIMRDSRTGAFGVIALVITLGLKASLLGGLLGPGIAAATVVAGAVLSRSLLPLVMHYLPRARSDGLAASAGKPTRNLAWVSLGLGAIASLVFLGGWMGLCAVIAAAVVALVMAWVSMRQIGGYTGDVLGATQQLAEVAIFVIAGAFSL